MKRIRSLLRYGVDDRSRRTPELGLELAWSDMVSTDVFNSNKCFAVFEEGRQK